MQVYRITNWNEHFENNRTRELKVLSWIPVPNKQDGDGYTELMDHKNGVAHFGCWHAILQVASKCDPRGTLLRDGKRAHDLASLSRITRISTSILKAAIERLLIIGWLEVYDNPALPCDNPAIECRPPEGKEGKGKKGREDAVFDIPLELNTPEFKKAWEDWIQHRKEIKKALTVQSVKMQMGDFVKWGAPRAIAAINYTIKRGWQGIREEESPSGFRNPAGPKHRPPVRDKKQEYERAFNDIMRRLREIKAVMLVPDDKQRAIDALRDKYRDIPGALKEALEIVG